MSAYSTSRQLTLNFFFNFKYLASSHYRALDIYQKRQFLRHLSIKPHKIYWKNNFSIQKFQTQRRKFPKEMQKSRKEYEILIEDEHCKKNSKKVN